jgi:hypothetical protein
VRWPACVGLDGRDAAPFTVPAAKAAEIPLFHPLPRFRIPLETTPSSIKRVARPGWSR